METCYDKIITPPLRKNFISYKRVALLGEEKWRIANIGLPCLDNIFAKEYASKKELIKKFELDLENL